jgi:hypothetical protein
MAPDHPLAVPIIVENSREDLLVPGFCVPEASPWADNHAVAAGEEPQTEIIFFMAIEEVFRESAHLPKDLSFHEGSTAVESIP